MTRHVHRPTLDGLRGVAIALVVIYHYTRAFDATNPLFRPGWSGVDLFFVLSGFLITGILLDSRDDPRYFRNFYARRALRILPLYYLLLIVFLFLFPKLLFPVVGMGRLPHSAWFFGFATNVYIAVHGWTPSRTLDPLWSLAIEEQFYLLWPAIVLACTPRALLRVCAGLALGALAIRIGIGLAGPHEIATYVLLPTRMDALAMGAMVACGLRMEYTVGDLIPMARRIGVICGLALGLFLVADVSGGLRLWDEFGMVMQTCGFTLVAMFYAALLVLSLESSETWWTRLLRIRVLRGIGKTSYAIYLLQIPILFGTIALFQRLGLEVSRASMHVAAASLLVVAAWLSWQLFERHFLRLKVLFEREPERPCREPAGP